MSQPKTDRFDSTDINMRTGKFINEEKTTSNKNGKLAWEIRLKWPISIQRSNPILLKGNRTWTKYSRQMPSRKKNETDFRLSRENKPKWLEKKIHK